MSAGDTIYALATAPGRAGVAVLRISGPQAGAALTALTGKALPAPRLATLRRLIDPQDGDALDQALLLWFPGPASFTGEDVAELHLHGGRAVIAGITAALSRLPGLRPADAGEFTRRAFAAGKLDLTGVEGLADLVDAETAAQRRQALRQMGGALAQRVEGWRDRLLRLLAHAEADIDFPDEDLPGGLADRVADGVRALAAELSIVLADGHRGERLRDGLHVVIVGAPNVGKSSLLNALARRDAAIVSHLAGTTRDVVEVHLELGGYPVILADTAGLRDGGDVIEQEGMARARARAENADIVLAVVDAARLPAVEPETLALLDQRSLLLVNKCDIAASVPAGIAGRPALALSARSGEGRDRLLAALSARCADLFAGAEDGAITRARHRAALEECRDRLQDALRAPAPELAAEDLRLAARGLGRITGRVDVEDLLDVIFRDFCIGK
ncbi:MAG TPA: tRNA uridine-5-carboxymethylaminomethyl(34) synthesis GTPase MnmE [Azospirillaceae bacterium]|nr:tRNA uridine-5-carboxymethylaminomethyl(34) synthesis GTPase MnmE [Azospirillaceae bacterium]